MAARELELARVTDPPREIPPGDSLLDTMIVLEPAKAAPSAEQEAAPTKGAAL